MSRLWWSASKRKHIRLDEMATPHLLHAHAKYLRGDAVDEGGNFIQSDIELDQAFDDEFKRRSVGPYAPTQPTEEGFA